MAGKVIILGAGGRFGRAAAGAFHQAGWQVRALARSWEGRSPGANVETVTADAFDQAALARAVEGCDVIVNALNPPYEKWAADLPRLTASVIAAARATGATVMLVGNVYNYGDVMPERLREVTPHRPTTRKGKLRVEMEQAYAAATRQGVRTIILRGGDFIERHKTGNWFDGYIAAGVAKGRAVYPGPLNMVHAWAYLPDMARAMVGLAEKRSEFTGFEEFGFAGYALTGRQLVDALDHASGRKLKVGGVPWILIRLLGLFKPQMREVVEMAYLWRTPHRVDGSKLEAVLPDLKPTPLEHAMADALADNNFRHLPASAQVETA